MQLYWQMTALSQNKLDCPSLFQICLTIDGSSVPIKRASEVGKQTGEASLTKWPEVCRVSYCRHKAANHIYSTTE